MGKRYSQLGLEDRCEIARLRAGGASLRAIAKALGRPASTIAREVARNTDRDAGYKPAKAQSKADQRCWRGARLDREAGLREAVLDGLKRGWSPEQVAGHLGRKAGRAVTSHESIYRFIYAQMRRSNDRAWRHYLPRAKARRGRRKRKGGSSISFIKDRISIEKRPAEIATRASAGHWEADLMGFSKYGQNILLAHERQTRLLLIARQPAKTAATVARRLARWLATLPPRLRQSMTFDNGTEFAMHHTLNSKLGLKTFFCDPHSPWQKGGIENAIGRVRRSLPRKTDLAAISNSAIHAAAARYNNTPRKCLGWNTPAEAFSQLVKPLHLECESTPPPTRGTRAESAALMLSKPLPDKAPRGPPPGTRCNSPPHNPRRTACAPAHHNPAETYSARCTGSRTSRSHPALSIPRSPRAAQPKRKTPARLSIQQGSISMNAPLPPNHNQVRQIRQRLAHVQRRAIRRA